MKSLPSCTEEYFRAIYNAKRQKLIERMADLEPATCRQLADVMGWGSGEARGKLWTARRDGLVHYDAETKLWSVPA